MSLKKVFTHRSLLGTIKTEVTLEITDGMETIRYDELRELERKVAYKFYLKARKRDLLTSKEVEGIVYFLGVNIKKLTKYLKLESSEALIKVIRGRKPSKMLSYMLLHAVWKELLFPNFYQSRFKKSIECDLDKEYFDLLVRNKVANDSKKSS